MINGKIKIVLVNPPLLVQDRYGRDLKNFGAISEPLGLAYLAANLEMHNYEVSIVDAAALSWGCKETAKELLNQCPDLIGITMLTPMFGAVKDLSSEIKKALPKSKIIVGGAHATALPQQTLNEIKEIDYVCVGEGENTVVDLMKYLTGKKEISEINGLTYRKNGETISNKPRAFETDLDKLPPPARHLLPMEKYTLTTSRTKGVGYCPTLIVARGCPFNCYYCSHPFGRSFRHHSTKRIVGEIQELIDKYNINQVNLEADTLTARKDFLMELCAELEKTGIGKKIKWTCESRVDTVDEEMLAAMKKAGCWQISYGVEAGTQRLLDLINKGEKLEQFERVFELTKKIGIAIRGFFMLGLPTETKKESWQTIAFAKKLDPLWAQFTIAVPYPGTPLFEMLKAQNKIRTYNWNLYNTWAGWTEKDLPFVPEGRTAKELQKLQRQALISFYLRPKVFFRFIGKIDSFKTFRKYLLGFFVLMKNKFFKK